MKTPRPRNPLERLMPDADPVADPAAPTDADVAGTGPIPSVSAAHDPMSMDSSDPGPHWGVGAMPAWLTASVTDTGGAGSTDLDEVALSDLDDPFADDDPPIRRRFAVAPPAALALIAIGVIACVVAGFGLFRDSEAAPAVDFGPTAGPSRPPAGDSSTVPAPAQLVVSVVGLVHRPGLVRLAAGSRVADAIASAGGARQGADTLSLNLAQVLRDGDQILVGYSGTAGQPTLRSAVVSAAGGESSAGDPSAGPSVTPSGAGGKVDLNTATEAQLDELPGVGPVTARAILEWRSRNGKFTSVDQLGEVDGIGPARLARLRDLVTV